MAKTPQQISAAQEWFTKTFSTPTPIQERAWETIATGTDALVIAPTGSGKTLAAFLFAIDQLMEQKAKATRLGVTWPKGVRVLYVSPLKALGADVERNLRRPLTGIATVIKDRQDGQQPQVTTAQRTGDTAPNERRRMLSKPPDILITTPESLYLMLTSQASKILSTVETVIIDEIHALAGTKRGAHLSLSLERLDELLETPAQRIGLSATVHPEEEVARFLGGEQPVSIVSANEPPNISVSVRVPVDDMCAITPLEEAGTLLTPDTRMGSSTIWPHIEAAIINEVLSHRSTIVFVNSRGLCERLTARLNDLYLRRNGTLSNPFAIDENAKVSAPLRSDMGSTSLLTGAAGPVIAKAHHGSVSKEQRRIIETELKQGKLPCVVATSSLELGIDMGDVDMVIQVSPPPSVSSGLQRIGRANHKVGGTSAGIIYPKVRTELIDAAVMAAGMQTGDIEATHIISNALDVLAQQTVAAVAMAPAEGLLADDWFTLVRRSACYSTLSRSTFDAVLTMLAGRSTNGNVLDIPPRILFDVHTGLMTALPRTARLAVTAAGTIPDRGLYPVMLRTASSQAGRKRVGELDEEMVHESRVGDVIILGTSTWKITEITADRVLVDPAPGRTARLPFWHGEGIGRSRERGIERGRLLSAAAHALIHQGSTVAFDEKMCTYLTRLGFDEHARANLAHLLRQQQHATGVIPNEHTLVIEQCIDETGGWHMIIHSPYGRRVHEPWALALTERITTELGFNPQAAAADDGILLHIPLEDAPLPSPEMLIFDPDEIEDIVKGALGSTSLFAARFRECAARALLMTPNMPGKRTPLWQQRIRGGQLLEAARESGDIPILAETARECLTDVYDMAGVRTLMEDLNSGGVVFHAAQTTIPSPFAAPLLFGYVAEHLYEGDLPHAEKNASLLSMDPQMLSELMGGVDVGALLDAQVVAEVESELQHIAPERRLHGEEGAAELLRQLGPLTAAELAMRLTEQTAATCDDKDIPDAHLSVEATEVLLHALEAQNRVFKTSILDGTTWVDAADAHRLSVALGTPVPDHLNIPRQQELSEEGYLLGLVTRYARTHALFTAQELAEALGTGYEVVREALRQLERKGRVKRICWQSPDSKTAPLGLKTTDSADPQHWVDTEVLKCLRNRSLMRARAAVKPVPLEAYIQFLFDRQGISFEQLPQQDQAALSIRKASSATLDALSETIARFEGVALPAQLWETTIFPARAQGYSPELLDELLKSGDVIWIGSTADDGTHLVTFFPTDSPFAPAPFDLALDSFEEVVDEPGSSPSSCCPTAIMPSIMRFLANEAHATFQQILAYAEGDQLDPAQVAQALLDGLWCGRLSVDSFALARTPQLDVATLTQSPQAIFDTTPRRVSSRRGQSRYRSRSAEAKRAARERVIARTNTAHVFNGRWSLMLDALEDPALSAIVQTESVIDRYGVVTRDIALAAGVSGGLGTLYPVLRTMEDSGDALRGIFVEELGPSQFADKATIEQLRRICDDKTNRYKKDTNPAQKGCFHAVVIAADDPANLFGSALAWPAAEGNIRPSRRSESLVVFLDGVLTLWAAPRLKHLVSFVNEKAQLACACQALIAHTVRTYQARGSAGARSKLVIETIDGKSVLDTEMAEVLQQEGLVRDTKGLRLYIQPF